MLQKPRVLIVDDIREVRELLRCVLETSGFAVAEAEEATMALDQLRKSFFNVVLLDIHLPGLSGLQALGPMKEINPYTKVVMITGDSSLPSAIEAIDGQAFAYLAKPIDMKELMLTLSQALVQQREELFMRKPLSFRLTSATLQENATS